MCPLAIFISGDNSLPKCSQHAVCDIIGPGQRNPHMTRAQLMLCILNVTHLAQNMYKLFEAAAAIRLASGCHARCSNFSEKSVFPASCSAGAGVVSRLLAPLFSPKRLDACTSKLNHFDHAISITCTETSLPSSQQCMPW